MACPRCSGPSRHGLCTTCELEQRHQDRREARSDGGTVATAKRSRALREAAKTVPGPLPDDPDFWKPVLEDIARRVVDASRGRDVDLETIEQDLATVEEIMDNEERIHRTREVRQRLLIAEEQDQ